MAEGAQSGFWPLTPDGPARRSVLSEASASRPPSCWASRAAAAVPPTLNDRLFSPVPQPARSEAVSRQPKSRNRRARRPTTAALRQPTRRSSRFSTPTLTMHSGDLQCCARNMSLESRAAQSLSAPRLIVVTFAGAGRVFSSPESSQPAHSAAPHPPKQVPQLSTAGPSACASPRTVRSARSLFGWRT